MLRPSFKNPTACYTHAHGRNVHFYFYTELIQRASPAFMPVLVHRPYVPKQAGHTTCRFTTWKYPTGFIPGRPKTSHSACQEKGQLVSRRVPVEREIINVYDLFELYDHTITCYKETVGPIYSHIFAPGAAPVPRSGAYSAPQTPNWSARHLRWLRHSHSSASTVSPSSD